MPEDDLKPEQFADVFAGFIERVAAAARPHESPLLDHLTSHLGVEPASLPVTSEQFDTFDAPNLQLAIDMYLREDGRSGELVGISLENKRFISAGLSDLVVRNSRYNPTLQEGPVDYANYHLANDEVLACVQFGLYLIRTGDTRLAALVTGPSEIHNRQRVRVEVMAAKPGVAGSFIADITELTRRLNIYRGHTIRLSSGMQIGPGPALLVEFQNVPSVARDDVVLPEGVLERIERHSVVFSEHADELRASGRSLKRGVLLHGLPGTGKTLTLMYLISRMPGRTVILVSGRGLGMIETIAKMARQLAPAMIVLEDVDLVAEERTMPGFRGGPILFELLNEMDGLRDDQDVIFMLTTNRADLLEPALAARPGRVDLAVELPLPEAAGRRRLIDLYARGLVLDDVNVDALVVRTAGASPAYIKELLRKSALAAVQRGGGTTVTQADLDTALDELGQGGRLAERILGYRPESAQAATGFPRQNVIPAGGESPR